MSVEQVKDRLNGPAYDFLRDNQDLSNCIYLTLSGSYGYGTNVEGSDIDLRGVLIEQPRYLYGLTPFEQFEDRQTDTVIYGLKKFVSLCASANPNTLELLGTEEDCIVRMTEAGQLLRDHVSLFLSQRVVSSFGNYATAQLRRLANALCRDHYDELEQEKHLANALNAQMEHFNATHQAFDKGSIAIRLEEENDEPKLLMDVHLTDYPVRDFASIYSQIQNTVRAYGKLNHRNRKKDDAHLYKHAMHLIRLLITGKDILEGKGIITKRTAEHKLLMEIRRGVYSYDEIFTMAETYQAAFDAAATAATLPKTPDMDKIESLLIELYSYS